MTRTNKEWRTALMESDDRERYRLLRREFDSAYAEQHESLEFEEDTGDGYRERLTDELSELRMTLNSIRTRYGMGTIL